MEISSVCSQADCTRLEPTAAAVPPARSAGTSSQIHRGVSSRPAVELSEWHGRKSPFRHIRILALDIAPAASGGVFGLIKGIGLGLKIGQRSEPAVVELSDRI